MRSINRNFVKEHKTTFMNARQIKEEIHSFINHADERFLRLVYSMVESEKLEKEFFDTTNDEMITRAQKSLKSIENGKTRNIHEFKKDIESWKKNRAIQ
jgi:polyhydroxyalkanoate synthesis regulator phasin